MTAEISAICGIPVGEASISPNRHVEVDNPGELLDMIAALRSATGKPVGFKAVLSGVGWLETLFALVHERGIESVPDFITVDSADGGTGAAPLSLIDNMGLPISESLLMAADVLIRYDLKERVRLIASGKLITPSEVAWALAAGADFAVSARGFMFSLGCIQALQCNKNSCPTGITTHNKKLQRGLVPKEKQLRVEAYARNMKKEVEIIAHAAGVREPRLLKRYHVRIQTGQDRSIPLDKLWPYPVASEALPPQQVAAE